MYYTSNERDYFSLSADIFNYENKHKCKREYTEMYFFDFYFLIVHISSNNVLDSLTFRIHVGNIHVEGIVYFFKSYFLFYGKKRVTFYLFF